MEYSTEVRYGQKTGAKENLVPFCLEVQTPSTASCKQLHGPTVHWVPNLQVSLRFSVWRTDFGPFSAYLFILVAKALSFILSMKLVSLAMLFLNEQEGWAWWLTSNPIWEASVDQEIENPVTPPPNLRHSSAGLFF